MRSITPEQLADRLRAGQGPRLIDVREPEEWQVARLPGAELVPLGEVPERLPGRLGAEEEVVVYCHHGVR
ncbi:MAG: rhodanese-like domain-containing protein, partial [Verrucomicrobiia bacterium]